MSDVGVLEVDSEGYQRDRLNRRVRILPDGSRVFASGKRDGRKRRPPIERFLGHAFPLPGPDACWEWTSFKDRDGYAMFLEARGLSQRAARFSYKTFVGPIPEGLVIDHLCRRRGCVNPNHLEPVTNRENILRGYSPRRERTHCKYGHEFTPENTYRPPTNNSRICRKCHRDDMANRRHALKAAA